MQLHNFQQADLLNHELVNQVAGLLNEAVALRGEAFAVVSGGKTPMAFFHLLAQRALPWEQITFCLADERCVSVGDAARNERMVRECLLQGPANQATLISLYDETNGDHLPFINAKLAKIPQFDLVILGMGEDGHTASLFPCSDELAEGLADNAPSVLIINPKNAPYKRVSLSKNRLLQSRALFLHLVGANKKAVLQQALALNNPLIMPICAFLNNHPHMQVMYAP